MPGCIPHTSDPDAPAPAGRPPPPASFLPASAPSFSIPKAVLPGEAAAPSDATAPPDAGPAHRLLRPRLPAFPAPFSAPPAVPSKPPAVLALPSDAFRPASRALRPLHVLSAPFCTVQTGEGRFAASQAPPAGRGNGRHAASVPPPLPKRRPGHFSAEAKASLFSPSAAKVPRPAPFFSPENSARPGPPFPPSARGTAAFPAPPALPFRKAEGKALPAPFPEGRAAGWFPPPAAAFPPARVLPAPSPFSAAPYPQAPFPARIKKRKAPLRSAPPRSPAG